MRRRLDHWLSGKERTCPKMTDWGKVRSKTRGGRVWGEGRLRVTVG